MHYKNGTPAKVGDKVVGTNSMGTPVAGVVVDSHEGNETCNLEVVPITQGTFTLTASECMRFDEALAGPVAVPQKEEESAED